MKALARYTVTATLIAVSMLAALTPFVGGPARAGLLAAVLVTLPLQIGLFSLLEGARGDQKRFMTFWGLGMLSRMVAVAALGLLVRLLDSIDATAAIGATVGLFFIYLLLEPVFLTRSEQATGYAR